MQEKDYSSVLNIRLIDTGLFNCNSGNSPVYNILINNGIKTLKELFKMDDLNKINYGSDKENENFSIHSEIDGIITLLRYKYFNHYLHRWFSIIKIDINIFSEIIVFY